MASQRSGSGSRTRETMDATRIAANMLKVSEQVQASVPTLALTPASSGARGCGEAVARTRVRARIAGDGGAGIGDPAHIVAAEPSRVGGYELRPARRSQCGTSTQQLTAR